jgi:LacI family transcriptional regulator
MNDVARAAGVSLKTVSRVVNAEPGVQPETARRVQSAIEQLGFRRHDGASSLRRGSTTSSIGLVLEDVADPFYSALTRAVEEVALTRRFLVLTGSSDERPEREQQLALAFCARRVDGLVLVPAAGDHSYLRPEIAAGTAVVLVDRPASGLDVDAVLVDNAGGTRSAVKHLLAHGHRRIGYLGDAAAIWTATERLRGYRDGLRRAGRAYDQDLVAMGPHDPHSVAAALRTWRTRRWPVTAVVTGNNRITVTVLRALAAEPDPPALVGFDDFELADLLRPGVTVVAQDPAAMGRTAAQLLFRRLDGDRGPAERVVLPTTLIARGTGERRP